MLGIMSFLVVLPEDSVAVRMYRTDGGIGDVMVVEVYGIDKEAIREQPKINGQISLWLLLQRCLAVVAETTLSLDVLLTYFPTFLPSELGVVHWQVPPLWLDGSQV